MSTNNEIRTYVLDVTPEMAEAFLARNIDNNRCVNKHYVYTWADEMKAGRWRLNGDAIRFSKSGKLIDGQHRLHAVIKAGVAVPFLIVEGVEDAAIMTIDCGKARIMSDTMKMYGINNYTNKAAIIRFVTRCLKGYTSNNLSAVAMRLTTEGGMEFYWKHAADIDKACDIAMCYYSKLRLLTASHLGGRIFLWTKDGFDLQDIEYFLDSLYSGKNGLKVCRQAIDLASRQKEGIQHLDNLLLEAFDKFCKSHKITPQSSIKW